MQGAQPYSRRLRLCGGGAVGIFNCLYHRDMVPLLYSVPPNSLRTRKRTSCGQERQWRVFPGVRRNRCNARRGGAHSKQEEGSR